MEADVNKITVGPRHRKEMGDLDSLAASMKDVGLMNPITVTADLRLIAGFRRLEAAKRLKWKTVAVRVLDVPSLLRAEHDENELRKDFTVSERVGLVEAMNPQERGGDRRSDQSQNFAIDRPTVDEAAKAAGFGNRETFRQAKAVVANGVPELVEALDAGDVSPSAAAEVACLPREEQREVLTKGPEAVKEKAKEIRENRPPRTTYPHSDRFIRWMRRVSDEAIAINTPKDGGGLGGIGELLAEPEKWDKAEVENYILPMLDSLAESIGEYAREIRDAFDQG